jgi:acetyl-CoA acetyltransferase
MDSSSCIGVGSRSGALTVETELGAHPAVCRAPAAAVTPISWSAGRPVRRTSWQQTSSSRARAHARRLVQRRFPGCSGARPRQGWGSSGALERQVAREADEVTGPGILSAGQPEPRPPSRGQSGIPVEKTALGINQPGGSACSAVAFGWQAIRNGDAAIGGRRSGEHGQRRTPRICATALRWVSSRWSTPC